MKAGETILVTGGNRGIGYAVVQAISTRSTDCTVIVASRDKTKAETAIKGVQAAGVKATLYPLELDVTSDTSIDAAVQEVGAKFGRLDVLINNAAMGARGNQPTEREYWNDLLNTNVTSIAMLSPAFLPLLKKADDPRIVNISSARGSFGRVTNGANPPVVAAAYSTSKSALNMLQLAMASQNPEVAFYAYNPGHCKTAFNGYRGVRDPLDAAQGVAELVMAGKGKYGAGFWECEKEGMREVPW